MGFVLKSVVTQATPADAGLGAEPRLSVFGTIHPDIFRLRAPIGASPLGVRVASLDPQIGLETQDLQGDSPATWQTASFHERFGSLDEPAAGFEDRFGSRPRGITGSVRLPSDRNVQKAARPMGRLPDAAPATTAAAPKKHIRPGQARPDPVAVPEEDDGRTAIYDISARVVYLPNGRKLEAHSGLGSLMDDPRHVHVRMHGATPPNVYKLTMREQLFHGVRAIRLNPVDHSKMHGRAGILAHSYMLGPNGDSNGCVSFNDYPAFLAAFQRGEVTRMVVVDRLDSPPGPKVASGSGWLTDTVKKLFARDDGSDRYASAGQ
ncbi:MAG: DUF2778 domain-containing protein [Rhodoplanes sp.]|uniref:DUF2778 domain-containing protein n=1 Tax=Rhodoplanes sp. TaxID=1968906 RepID=UPI00182A93D7|nr:DUF2778 domain-containing protein [Rhodoplanes sp.]NVO12404.1 DUF2778 domain-containing protein [Rhodoplanes sp.]